MVESLLVNQRACITSDDATGTVAAHLERCTAHKKEVGSQGVTRYRTTATRNLTSALRSVILTE
jgi:hypothetical protein